MQLGVGLGNDLDDAAVLDGGKTLQPQRRQKHIVYGGARHRFRRDDVDRPLHPRVEHEVLAGDLTDHLHHTLDVGIDEIEGDDIGTDGRGGLLGFWHRCGNGETRGRVGGPRLPDNQRHANPQKYNS